VWRGVGVKEQLQAYACMGVWGIDRMLSREEKRDAGREGGSQIMGTQRRGKRKSEGGGEGERVCVSVYVRQKKKVGEAEGDRVCVHL